jgi:O-antigen/teichoic acid export membrane protein
MITLTVLLAIAVVCVIALFLGGSAFLIAFGDIIFAGLIIYWLVKMIINQKKKKE